jgi:hypothetical protein
MKKNILSLVAFMAFSVGAFANIEEVTKEIVEVKEEVVVVAPDCYEVAEAIEFAYNQVMKDMGMNPSNIESYNVFAAAYDRCDEFNIQQSLLVD